MTKNSKRIEPADIATGARIRQIRIMRGLSQEKIAEACGITFQQIQKYENGTNRVSASRIMQIADALGVQPSTLLPEAEGQVETLPVYSPEQTRAASIFAEIPVHRRDLALKVLRSFIETEAA